MKQKSSPLNRIILAPLLALGVAGAPALAQDAPARVVQQEARIPFANHGGIRDWRPGEDDRTIYVQSRARDWYKATLMSKAFGLPFALAVGFDAGPVGTFDRFSNVLIEGQRYPVESLVRIEGAPPSRHAAEEA